MRSRSARSVASGMPRSNVMRRPYFLTGNCLTLLPQVPTERSPMKRLFGSLLFCAIVACRPADGSTASTTEAAVPVHVHVTAVVIQPMPEYVTLTGTLRGNQESDVAA